LLVASPADPRRANRWYAGWTSLEQGLDVGPESASCRAFRRDHRQHRGGLHIEARAKTQRNPPARATRSRAMVAVGAKGSSASRHTRLPTDRPVVPQAAALGNGEMSAPDVGALRQARHGRPLRAWLRGLLQNSVNTAVTA
jgi:hypothetical protein